VEEIYTVPEVAKILKISQSKLYAWAKQGKLPSVKIGKNVRIRESDLVEWLKLQQRQGASNE
jgi:excisionase family DNA binding protein